MGVAQNALQGLVGTTTAAAVAIGHAADTKAHKKEEGLLAKEQNLEAQADLKEIEAGLPKAAKDVQEKQAIYEQAMNKRYGGKGNTKAAIAEQQRQALDDLQAAQLADEALEIKKKAILARLARTALKMKRGGIK